MLLALVAVGLSAYQAGIGRITGEMVNWGGLPQVSQFVAASLQPDLSSDFLRVMGRAAGVTLAYAIVGSGLSIALGLVGGVVSSRIWWQILFPPGRVGHRLGRGLWLCTRGLLAFPRAIHELIWGLMLLQLFGLDPLVAVGAIAIPFGAIVAKVFSEILDETPREPL